MKSLRSLVNCFVIKGLFLIEIAATAGCAGFGANSNKSPSLNPIETQGKQVFEVYCAHCHETSSDAVIVGPSLANIGTEANSRVEGLDAKSYLEISILEPSAFLVKGYKDVMPATFTETFTAEELNSLVTYLLTLK